MFGHSTTGMADAALDAWNNIRAPLNAWYMLGWAKELSAAPIARTILGQELVAWRQGNGLAVALEDRCAHRFAPLSMGTVIDDTIRCPYHGLQYDGAGQCVKQFFPRKAPENARVRGYPVVEQETILWVWMGDPALKDELRIPSFPYLVDPAFKSIQGLSNLKSNYHLVTDNLMDLSHAEFLHPAFAGALRTGKYSAKQNGSTVDSNWAASEVLPTPVIQSWWPENGGMVDFWLDMRWDAPAAMLLLVGATHPGRPRSEGFEQPSVHILTPETESSTHYFWNGGIAADHPQDMDQLYDLTVQAFEFEDAPMIEAVFKRMHGKPLEELEPVLLPSDAGIMRARRILEAMINLERSAPSSAGEKTSG
jgi:phenylpropionate dioxygenase-like ring-hydroxylating dioxygenase large terminal subunit